MGDARTPPPGQTPGTEEPKKGIEVGLLPFVASLVGLVLVAGIIGGVLWFTREGAAEPVATNTVASQPEGAITEPPALSVEARGEKIIFTVSHSDYSKGDAYVLRTGPDEEAIKGMYPSYLRDGRTRLEVGVQPGYQACAQAQLTRNDQRSPWSKMACERGKN